MINNYNDNSTIKLGSLLKGEHEYLNQIKDKWMELLPMPRTNVTKYQGEEVVIGIERLVDGKIIELEIPDFSGETFDNHFSMREWNKEFSSAIDGIDGLMLFIDACDPNNKPRLLHHQNRIEQSFGIKNTNEGVEYVPWDSSHTSNQVKLVESLQFIEHHKTLRLPIKVAVVISLWDEVEKSMVDILPDKWFEDNMPLLYQYLLTNKDTFDYKSYGISSQGGNYGTNRDELADLDPLKRVIINDGLDKSHEIEKPIIWIAE